MPIRSGAMQRPRGCRCGNTLRQRYDEVGLPCSSTMGSPSPTSTYAISLPRIRRRCFWYGNAAEIMFVLLPCSSRISAPTSQSLDAARCRDCDEDVWIVPGSKMLRTADVEVVGGIGSMTNRHAPRHNTGTVLSLIP